MKLIVYKDVLYNIPEPEFKKIEKIRKQIVDATMADDWDKQDDSQYQLSEYLTALTNKSEKLCVIDFIWDGI